MWSLDKFGLIHLGAFTPLLALVAIVGGLVAFWAWQESKRYYLCHEPMIAQAEVSATEAAERAGGFRSVPPSSSRIWSGPIGSRCSIGCGRPSRSRGCRPWAGGW